MAETTKQPGAITKRIMNRTVVGRIYHTADGRVLGPGAVLDVLPEEHDKLIRYHDLVDADKLGPSAKTLSATLKENEELRKRVAELEDEGEDSDKLKERIAALQAKLSKAGKK